MKKPVKVVKKAPKKGKTPTKAKASFAPGASAGNREQSVSIRKIDNGFITRTSGMIGKGDKARYVENETFSKAQPKVTVPK
jgi:hypothetical protein